MKGRVWNAALSAYHDTVQKLRKLAADESGEGGRKAIVLLIVVLLAAVAAAAVFGDDITGWFEEQFQNML